MTHFTEQCAERYFSSAPAGTKLKKVNSPFVAEDAGVGESRAPVSGAHPVQCTWCAHTFPSEVGRQLFKAEGKHPDGHAASRGTTEAGELAGSAAKILMKILHAARLARWDMLRAVDHLACFCTWWATECDRKLHRLVSCLNETKSVKTIGWVADDLKGISLDLFADADFAGCIASQRSTSGAFLCWKGPNTCFGLSCISRG